MANPVSLLRHSYVARTTLLLVGSDLFSKGAVFLLQMYLARVFDKGAMGSLSYCMTIILLTSAVVDLGVNSSLVRFASERLAAGQDAGGVVRLALRLKLLTGALVVAIGLVLLARSPRASSPPGGWCRARSSSAVSPLLSR
jgi:O-antigen/teichoic acid export membrane protein